ncbi:long-chain fatty acid transport protein 4-like [Stegodyphus dumicola]|uniref:long-chain fatty acid transport protein 4-like n=1 Tax=Stegodyphus dumicola TaxID=202533 RepID=UPI0015AE03B1|nr:long-chain fatty acid transport protein 4-like [Stegodyphus dumicola]
MPTTLDITLSSVATCTCDWLTDNSPSQSIIHTAARLYFKALSFVRKCHYENLSVVDLFRNIAKKYPHKVCFVFQDEEWTYQQVDDLSNKVAHCFLSRGYKKGDEVALFLENCVEYICIWLGLAKIGVIISFINTNLRKDSLVHSINVIDAKAVIFGKNLSRAVEDAIPFVEKRDTMEYYCFYEKSMTDNNETVQFPAKSLNLLLDDASESSADIQKIKINFQDKLLYIYTSGTTGLPKAAIIRHSRFIWISAAAKYVAQLKEFETFYNPLPLYHSAGGILFLSVVLAFGGKMVVRKKFSASNFWKEAVKHKATVSQYIGEICRYLLNQPRTPEETQHSIWLFFGNGLRSHIWKEFKERFQIKSIVEMYGATEGNANLTNMFGKLGAVGFVSRILFWLYPVRLIKVDPETGKPLRNARGLCIQCQPGEPGEMVGKIVNSNPINQFDGYVSNKDTEKKIIRDCFTKGDMAFLSGDILVMDEEGYLYFVDRTGDTFRWRGENVSTGEVENVISKALNHVGCVVYGVEVPNVEGRAGMAAIQIDLKDIDLDALYQHIGKSLPSYAVPLFIRICSNLETTGTYKLRKVTLQKDGFNPEKIADPLFFFNKKTCVPLTKEVYLDIITGKIKL